MSEDNWDARYRAQIAGARRAEPLPLLLQYAHLLPPPPAPALDLACGLGASSLWLAARGYHVSAWDQSAVAIEWLRAEAGRRTLPLDAQVRDVCRQPPPPASCRLLLVAHFLERALFPSLLDALLPGGLLIYQTHTVERPPGATGPSNPDYLLQANELLRLAAPLRVLAYREEGAVGYPPSAAAGLASLVARKV